MEFYNLSPRVNFGIGKMLTVFAFGKMKLQLPILRLYVLNRMSHFVLFKSILGFKAEAGCKKEKSH